MYNFFQYVFLSLFVCATGQAAMVSPEANQISPSISIIKRIPVAFHKAKEIYVLKNAEEFYVRKQIKLEEEYQEIANEQTSDAWVNERNRAEDTLQQFEKTHSKKIDVFLNQLRQSPKFQRTPLQEGESYILNRLAMSQDPTLLEYSEVKRKWYCKEQEMRLRENKDQEFRLNLDILQSIINYLQTSTNTYQKFYRKTVQYTINGVGTFVGAAIGCLIGHAVAPKIIKKVTQLSYFKQLTPAKQTKIVKALPWVSRLTGGLLSAGIAFLATNTLVDWGHRTVLGI